MIAFHDEPAKIFQWEVGAASTCSSFARPLLVPGPGRARGVGMGAPVGPSLRASRGDPVRRLTARVPPCSRSVQRGARIAPRFPRSSPAEGPRRSRHVARDLHVLPAACGHREGEGRWAWTRRNPGLRPARGHLPPERRAGGGWPSCGTSELLGAEVPWFTRPTRGIVPPGKTHSPSPSGLSYDWRLGGMGRTCCEPCLLQARVRWACFTLSFFVPIPGKDTTTFMSSPLPIRSRILPTPHSGCLTLIPGW
jgi:hypothetical protein